MPAKMTKPQLEAGLERAQKRISALEKKLEGAKLRENRQAEQALRLNESRFQALIEHSADAIAVTDARGTILYMSPSSQKIGGYTPEELLHRDAAEQTHPDDLERRKQVYAEVLANPGKPVYVQWRRRHKDGSWYWLEGVATNLLHVPGVNGIVTNYRDITDRKQAEAAQQTANDELELKVAQRTAALSESNALLQTLLDHMPDHIYFKDAEGRFIRNSKAQAVALGVGDPSEVVGRTDFDFFPHAQRAFNEEQEVIRTGKPLVDFEERVVWPDGRETWVSTTKMPLRDGAGKIVGTFGISRDITNRKRNEQALQTARDELEAFSYSVSHDLRAPLRGIDGWSLALLEDYGDKLDEQGLGYLKRVRSETQHMGDLIDDLLQLSRITRAEMKPQPVDLSAIARAIVARLKESEPGRKVEFVIQEKLKARGDPHLLEVALTNLLGNAFKFTGRVPAAHIEFGQTGVEGVPAFYVRDNGAGFDMAFAHRLFSVFQRMHKESEFPGTGVGLATVQRIIHRHGGSIWAASDPGQGATFYFRLEDDK